MNNYEKPKLIFSDVRLNENIADTCWGLSEGHNHNVTRYYDVDGPGYVSFNVIGSGKCANPNAYNIFYYEYEGADSKKVDGSAYETELERALSMKGGSDGQPYKGLDFDFPQKPKPSWS